MIGVEESESVTLDDVGLYLVFEKEFCVFREKLFLCDPCSDVTAACMKWMCRDLSRKIVSQVILSA